MKQLSIRSRLAAWYAIVLLASLILFAGGIWFTLRARLMENIDAELAQRVEGLHTVAQIEGGHRGPASLAAEFEEFAREVTNGSLIEVRDQAGAVMLPRTHTPVYAETDLQQSIPQTVSLRGRPVRALRRSFTDRGLVYSATVGTPLDLVEAVLQELRDLTIAVIPAVLLLAAIGGYLLSRRALAPVDQITLVARSISERNLSARLPISGIGDELDRMSHAWNDVLQRLGSALERIRRFTADASHELRTPIALIRASAELALRRERSPDEYRVTLREIQTHAERMTDLTASLLALARADAVGPSLTLELADLSPLVQQTVAEATAIAAPKALQLDLRLPATPVCAAVNFPSVRRLLMILLDNALKFTPAGGHVTVTLSQDDGGAVLAVSDTGPGMDPQIISHIFERFYRADTARDNSGTGLGLPIAQMIAEAHGTSVEVDSAPGRGSTFKVLFKTSRPV